jgi:hypothetical protein
LPAAVAVIMARTSLIASDGLPRCAAHRNRFATSRDRDRMRRALPVIGLALPRFRRTAWLIADLGQAKRLVSSFWRRLHKSTDRRDDMKKFLIVAATAFALTGPALANQCPALMQQVDAAMETTTISEEDKAKVTELRASGEAAHEAGDHAKAEADLNEALAILAM